ncbi:exodeoxyribonuclease V subunit gamma, partial [Photobacterium phosphoreum]|nr:exodeoxyribonuclease V subunit gamma [Photobacterium phosphoreum]
MALAEEQLWQPALWRALLHGVSRTGLAALVNSGRAAVHAQFMCAISDLPDNQQPACLPRRIVVFGISALPRQSLEVLAALSRWTQVLMCIHNPCEHFWADIVPDKDLLRASQSRQKRRLGVPPELNEELIMSHAHPLLAAWGKQGRDFIGLLDEHDSDASRTAYLPQFTAIQQRIDLFSSPGQATMLQQLQDDILDLRPVTESLNRWPDFDPEHDQSIRFHSAHSPQREVEILHDQLLDALNTDVSLRPRDIMVMVPDINQYAPHIQVVFGLPNVNDEHDKRYIPYNVADQNQQQINPLLNAVDLLLNLPNSRVTVSNLLDLLDVPAIRNRFDLPETALPIVRAWIQGANIRWGLHTEHRKSLGLPVDDSEAAHNTWLFGLRRMLLAYAVGAQKETWQGIQAYDEIGGLDAALLGPLLNVFDTLDTTWRSLSKPATVNIWCQRLNQLLDQFFVDDDDGDAYTLQQLKMAREAWQVA